MKSMPPIASASTISAVASGDRPTLGLMIVPIRGSPKTPRRMPLLQFFGLAGHADEGPGGLFTRHDGSGLFERVCRLDPIASRNALIVCRLQIHSRAHHSIAAEPLRGPPQ